MNIVSELNFVPVSEFLSRSIELVIINILIIYYIKEGIYESGNEKPLPDRIDIFYTYTWLCKTYGKRRNFRILKSVKIRGNPFLIYREMMNLRKMKFEN